MNQVLANTLEINICLANFIADRSPDYQRMAVQRLGRLQEAIEQLQNSTSDDAEKTQVAQQLRVLAYQNSARAKEFFDNRTKTASVDLGALTKSISPLIDSSQRILHLQTAEIDALSDIRRQQNAFLNNVQKLIWLTLILNLFLYLFLWLLFSQGILKRVQLLVTAARSLPLRPEKVTIPIGSDELGVLGAQLE